MSKTAGVVLILGGLGLVAFVLSSEVAVMGTDAARRVEDAKIVEPVAVPRPQPVLRKPSAPRPEAPVIVTLAPRSGEAAMARTAAIPKDRDSLARELQKELRRVGCYEGELNGVWTPATRRAMKTFTDRVNATLPIEEPDAVLFAMVQSQQDRVCGKPCPVDQGLSEDGRCLPNAILAKTARKPSPSAVATHVPASGGPDAGKPLPARNGWSPAVTAARRMPVGAPAAPAPSQVVAAPAVAAPAVAVIAPAPAVPLPTEERMGLAGPQEQAPGALPPAPGASPTGGPLATPRPAQGPPKRGLDGNQSWTRTMNARRFDSPN